MRLIELTRDSTRLVGVGADLAVARAQFDATHAVLLEGFLAPAVLALARRALAGAPFHPRVHARTDPPAVDLAMEPNALLGLLTFLCNDPRVLAFVEELTGCRPLGNFHGAVYKMEGPHLDAWHDDWTDTRRVAMSVNLGEAYEGGTLRIRERASGREVTAIANTGPGDALVFRLSPHLQHRLDPVTGPVAKVAFAGWFRERPAYHFRAEG